VDKEDKDGKTALDLAIERRNHRVVNILSEAKQA